MATKKFIIEVEEGHTECKNCPFRVTSKGCAIYAEIIHQNMKQE